jgi:hypothetical protein
VEVVAGKLSTSSFNVSHFGQASGERIVRQGSQSRTNYGGSRNPPEEIEMVGSLGLEQKERFCGVFAQDSRQISTILSLGVEFGPSK